MDEVPPPPPRTLPDIVNTIEQNAALLNQALWSNSVRVKARFDDRDGREHLYTLDGNLLYQRPRGLRLDLRPGVGGTVMGIGSNDAEYWVWIEPELKMMRWGKHQYVGESCAGDIPVQPDRLVASLGVCSLPSASEGLIGPARKYGKQYDILYYMRQRPDVGFRLSREYWVDRSPPYQVALIVFRDDLGRRSMSVAMHNYAQAWEGGPMVAREININWPGDDGFFTMWLDRVTGMTADKVHARAFDRPTTETLPSGVTDVVQVDADCE